MTAPALARNVRGKGRHYEHPDTGELLPSITNIIGCLDKPALPRWAAKMVAENAWKMRHSLAEMGEEECIDVLKGSPWRRSTRAADRGTSVHEWLEAVALGGDVGPVEAEMSAEARTYLPGAKAFIREWEPLFHWTEFTVFGDGYAGTGDFIAELDGRMVIGDFKTSKALYPEVALQLAALRYADKVVDAGGFVDMPKVDGCVGVLISPSGCEVRPVDAGPEAFKAFMACLTAWRWQKGDHPVGEPLRRGVAA